jgi:succinate dehydrogenase assembly factor 2
MLRVFRACQTILRIRTPACLSNVPAGLSTGSQDASQPSDNQSQFEDPPPIPVYKAREGETTGEKRARLLYQSRKRGMLENGILLSCFAGKYLKGMNDDQLSMFDNLINKPSNDWDIFHWITGKTPTPTEYQSEIMDSLKEFVQNKNKQERLRQPDL